MKLHALRQEGYQLLHDGAVALAQVESNGIRIDVPLAEQTVEKLGKEMRALRVEMEKDDVWRVWQRRYGAKANITAPAQLASILHIELKYEVGETTETGRPATDDEALQKIDHPFVRQWQRLLDLRYAQTCLKGVLREVVDGRLHPFFNLHTARTFRSSSDSPNFQNFPVRNKEIAELVRRCFIASPGSVIAENDFKGIEVGVSACYHKDANFISYITTPGKDMHRDMAAQIYCLDPKDVSKDARYGAKNKFVFPQFYGDYYLACAKSLWEWIDKGKLTAPDGVSLKKHLRSKGIKGLGACDPEQRPVKGTFEFHLKEVENDFWNNRFRDYGRWKKDWFATYLEKGYFDLYSGFRIYGTFQRNAVTNYPVQGSAFHCLLWTLIQVNKALRRYNMRSLVVGQIHDSLIGDVKEKELTNYLEIVEYIVTVKLRKHYPWLIVPLEVEYEICARGASWFEKKETKFKLGRFNHPKEPDKWTGDSARFLDALGRI